MLRLGHEKIKYPHAVAPFASINLIGIVELIKSLFINGFKF